MREVLPEMITKLPEIDRPNDDIKGYLNQGELSQSFFFIIKAGTYLQEHSHAAQWGKSSTLLIEKSQMNTFLLEDNRIVVRWLPMPFKLQRQY